MTRSDPPSEGPLSRRDRRAAERLDARAADRRAARARQGARGSGRGGGPSMGLITGLAVLVGVVVIGIVAVTQLGGSNTDDGLSSPPAPYEASLVDGRALGRADAPVTIDAYADFQCPFCARYALSTEPLLVNRYVRTGVARIVFHDVIVVGRGTDNESVAAAEAARCAGDQGAFWTLHDWLFQNQDGENQGGFRRERLVAIADAAGLDVVAFEACLDAATHRQEVLDESSAAFARGVNSTPTLIINGEALSGSRSVDELGAAIEAAAAAAGSPAPSAASSGS